MRHFKLSACIVAVSGGIDSAAVLGIVHRASKWPNSPIKKIVPVLLPDLSSKGVTGQQDATDRGKLVCAKFGLAPIIINVKKSVESIKKSVDSGIGIVGEKWAEGQLVPYTRTPTLYYIASLLSQEGTPSIICGTTNKDEGAYLGYVGKASDGMVDVQLISDLHKSEVYEISSKMEIPDAILNTAPTGDMYDGRIDVDVFGAPYDFVELYLTYLSYNKSNQLRFLDTLDEEGRNYFEKYSANLENLHKYNLHKYLSGSPAVHLDVITNKVPGKWGAPTPFLKKLLEKLR
jgi:NAD+ synthase (glutamine-hydrolysing)